MTDRYSRQRLFQGVGEEGQQRLGRARILLVGCGALGTHIAQQLVRAGVGQLRICDRDFVELNNLQRQVLFDEDDAGSVQPKAQAALTKLRRVNSEILIEAETVDLRPDNVRRLSDGVDLILDGTDNFETRYLINDVAIERGLPWVYGGVVGSHGMVLPIDPNQSACLTCLMPEAPPPGSAATCDTAGVLAPAVAVVASIQVTEALKIVVGSPLVSWGTLTTFDIWRSEYRRFEIRRNSACRSCHARELDYLKSRRGQASERLCGRNAVQIQPRESHSEAIDLEAMSERLSREGRVLYNGYLLRFEHDDLELTLYPDGRAIVKGTEESKRARAFYSKFVGA